MAKQRKNTAPKCPECGQTHDGMCRHESHYTIDADGVDRRKAVNVGGMAKRLMGFGNKRS